MSNRRVAITGMGIMSPVGIGLEQNWQNIIAGNSGISTITEFDTTGMPSNIAGVIRDFDPANWLDGKSIR